MAIELLTRDALAERFGIDIRTLTRWVQGGMPQRSRSGKPVYAWPECRDWREKRIREDGRAARDSGGNEDRKTQMAEARLRALLAEAERAELDLAERRSELVTVAFMRAEFSRIAEGLRGRLLSIPAAWEPTLAGCDTSIDRQLALQELTNQLLPLLGAAADDDGEPEESGQAGDDDSPTAVPA